MGVCPCVPQVKSSYTVAPHPTLVKVAKAVVLTICDCDRRSCPVDGCEAKIDPNASRCVNGHRS